MDESAEVGVRHDRNLFDGYVVRPAFDVVQEVGGEVELRERVSESPHPA